MVLRNGNHYSVLQLYWNITLFKRGEVVYVSKNRRKFKSKLFLNNTRDQLRTWGFPYLQCTTVGSYTLYAMRHTGAQAPVQILVIETLRDESEPLDCQEIR